MKITRSHELEKVFLKNMELSLLASGDGTEVIHHKLYEGARWAMIPEEGWTALEHVTILSGELIFHSPDGALLLMPGDSIHSCPVEETSIFAAKTDVEFLYVTSQPQFHYYSNMLQEMKDLAVRVEEKDGYTAHHCERIKNLSMKIGDAIGLSTDEKYTLNLAAFLHDIGKVKVPDDILNKPGKLTDEEYEIMKKHTTWGRETLEQTNRLDLIKAGKVVEQHHERYDGRGYPNGLKGNEISIQAQIITVVDAFDAMTSDRVYRKAMSVDEAFQELERHKGTMFHPDIVDAFFSIQTEVID
ncbi:HD-GYP domain-containing protein [Halobacillus yeomjeoni]|uniref:HD-GYP domain-containing protein n=1 Tax=Halobacillus yeomjeoni TaxID=311194 RepID=UPI001CD4C4BD|nr:HD-GYP domain-containing protein [Halobacillus yeomjeoni]MCA0984228.1 HD-GYP domain-containing protein [Halobacillus yeomjeoni]